MAQTTVAVLVSRRPAPTALAHSWPSATLEAIQDGERVGVSEIPALVAQWTSFADHHRTSFQLFSLSVMPFECLLQSIRFLWHIVRFLWRYHLALPFMLRFFVRHEANWLL
ncbi:hypothetical protein BDW68DRAFT_123514 [Aspergillus falconensis]